MIGLLRMILLGIPSTIWYGTRIVRGARKGGEEGRRICEELPRAWARSLLKAARVEVRLENPEVIRPGSPQVLVANHVSWFDVLALAAFHPAPYRFVAKKELARIPFFGPAWVACGHIAIDRQDRTQALQSLAVAREGLETDRPTVILFPEGTRSRDGMLRPFKKGAFVLAIQGGAEVVPVAVLGTREVMSKGAWLVHSGTVTLRYGDPLSVDGLTVADRDGLTRRAHDAVAALIAPPQPTA